MAALEERTAAQAQAADKAHVFHSWSVQGAFNPTPIRTAHGVYMEDFEGRQILDFTSQLVNTNIGHQHPKVIEAIKAQADLLCTIGPAYANDTRSELARLVAEQAPGNLNWAFFTNGGAEAIENAIRMARLYTGRQLVLSAWRSYHGATAGAITLTGEPRSWAAAPGIPGVHHFSHPYLYRSSFNAATPEEERDRALKHLEETLMYLGEQNVAAIILESVTGTNGILVPPDGYLQGVRELCTKHGIVMISDEVMAGFGRTGEWFAVDNWSVTPDLMAVAKGINSGYVPLGALLISDPIAEHFRDKFWPGGLTYSGHPLAAASAVAAITAMREEGIIENAKRVGADRLGPGLRALAERHPSIGEVRGLGCFWGVELVKSRETREPLVPFNAAGPALAPIAELSKAAWSKGLALMAHWNVLLIVPPLIVTDEQVDEGLEILDAVLELADRHTV